MVDKTNAPDKVQPQDLALDSLAKLLYLSKGTLADGQPYYAYLSVSPSNYQKLQAAEASGNFKLNDYGKVLGGEIGVAEPSPFIQQEITRIFNLTADDEKVKEAFLDLI